MIGCALALIALAGCKTPELSMDERISLPESGEMFQFSSTGFWEVLSAEERYLESALAHIDIVTAFCRKKILLYRALGGGC